MAWGNENTAQNKTASLADLRTIIADRLQTAQRRLDPASATAAFADANASHHDSMIGSLIFGMVCWTPVMEMFGGSMDGAMAVAVNSPMLAAAADGLSMVWDEKAYKNRRRMGSLTVAFKDGIYHGGRNQAGNVTPAQIKRNFNMIAANENARFAYDAAAEVAGMSEMLDMIDRLEQRGVSLIALDANQSVSQTLHAALSQNMQKPKVYGQSALMRMAA